jgi:cyclase
MTEVGSSFRARVIPCLLLDGFGLVKTVRFKERTYLGDPVNTVRIFNEKGADELVLLDINASRAHDEPNYDLLAEIASEAFMPLGYGGGIRTLDQIRKILGLGYEKVVLNTHAGRNPDFVSEAAAVFGRSTIVVAVDVFRSRFGATEVRVLSGTQKLAQDPVSYATDMARRGAGELLVTSIDREGTFKGYDLGLISTISSAVSVPVVANGGASSVRDFTSAIAAGATATAAASMFVFNGRHRAVLITYPSEAQLSAAIAVAGS